MHSVPPANPPKNKKSHLVHEERFTIEKMLHANDELTTIAKTLERGLSTISKEVSRNGGRKKYTAHKAGLRAKRKQARKKRDCNKVAMTPGMPRIIERELREGRSPEATAAMLKKRGYRDLASAKSIRKYVAKRSGLEAMLFWNRNTKKGGPKKTGSIFLKDPGRKPITERPKEALTDYGHWEMDFVVSSWSTVVLLVLVERKTKSVRMMLIPNRTLQVVHGGVVRLLKGYTVHTITTDNDIAFVDWRTLEVMTGASIYFCHPYHSWEKGLVENSNRWIREFLKKKSDLAGYTDTFVSAVEEWLNHGPRVCLQGASAYEMMMQYEYGKFVSSLSINYPRVSIRG